VNLLCDVLCILYIRLDVILIIMKIWQWW